MLIEAKSDDNVNVMEDYDDWSTTPGVHPQLITNGNYSVEV